jgi:dTDP-glucose 4,6-dehydratase
MQNVLLVTGGAGFIGSNFIRRAMATDGCAIVNLDKLTYAGNVENLASLRGNRNYTFVKGDINDRDLVADLLTSHQPRAIVHFAAESHVDRSIRAPQDFIRTNVNGTFELLEAARCYWEKLEAQDRDQLRFVHVSTDEVYGSLEPDELPAAESRPYSPTSPYAASKAAADHFVRSYHRTYGVPAVITNCSNNYGPYQFPEKLIPLMILNALRELPLPVYGDGEQVRDWLYVIDHCDALRAVLERGRPGETYNISGDSQVQNLDVVRMICRLLDEFRPRQNGSSYSSLISFVKDRPGHDRRYSLDAGKIREELGWRPAEVFDTGMRETVKWYLENKPWVDAVMTAEYDSWIKTQYATT